MPTNTPLRHRGTRGITSYSDGSLKVLFWLRTATYGDTAKEGKMRQAELKEAEAHAVFDA